MIQYLKSISLDTSNYCNHFLVFHFVHLQGIHKKPTLSTGKYQQNQRALTGAKGHFFRRALVTRQLELGSLHFCGSNPWYCRWTKHCTGRRYYNTCCVCVCDKFSHVEIVQIPAFLAGWLWKLQVQTPEATNILYLKFLVLAATYGKFVSSILHAI